MAEVKIQIIAEDEATPTLVHIGQRMKEIEKLSKQTELPFAGANIGGWITTVLTSAGVAMGIKQLFDTKETILSIKSFREDIIEIKTRLKDLNSTWSKIYDETVGNYINGIKDITNELDYLNEYMSDLRRDFKDAPFLDLSKLEQRRDELMGELEKLLDVSLGSFGREALGRVEEGLSSFDAELNKSLTIDVAQAVEALRTVNVAADAFDFEKKLYLDVSQSISAISEVSSALAAIPDVTVKTLVIKTMTEASPAMPFSKGMEYINSALASLPKESPFTVRFEALAKEWQGYASSAEYMGSILSGHRTTSVSPGFLMQAQETDIKANKAWIELASMIRKMNEERAMPRNITFSPTINVSGEGKDGKRLAKEIDGELAGLWRADRSELKKEATKK